MSGLEAIVYPETDAADAERQAVEGLQEPQRPVPLLPDLFEPPGRAQMQIAVREVRLLHELRRLLLILSATGGFGRNNLFGEMTDGVSPDGVV